MEVDTKLVINVINEPGIRKPPTHNWHISPVNELNRLEWLGEADSLHR